MSNLLSLLQSWTAARQEAPEGELVPFGSSPAASFSLSEGTCVCRATLSRPARSHCASSQPPHLSLGRRCCTCMARRPSRCRASCRAFRCALQAHAVARELRSHSVAQVGAPVPAEKRLKFASELFDVVDVGGQRVLDAHKLQARCARLREQLNTLARD